MKYENNTRIKFNNKLKKFINNIKQKYPNIMTSFMYEDLLEDQEKLRLILLENQNEIDICGYINTKSQSMPDYFAFICAYINDLSNCNNWNDITNVMIDTHINNSTDGSLNNILFPEYDDDIDCSKKQVQCCCSQNCYPDSLTILSNPITNLNLLIACSCITKTGIVNNYKTLEKLKPKSFQNMVSKRNMKKKQSRKMIHNFEKFTIALLTNRKCKECHKYNIKVNEKEHIKLCKSCYFYSINPPVGKCLLLNLKK